MLQAEKVSTVKLRVAESLNLFVGMIIYSVAVYHYRTSGLRK
jgi:hypothetical protein